MLPKQLLLLCFAIATSRAQSSDTTETTRSSSTRTITSGDNGFSFSNALSTLSSIPASFTGSEYTYLTDLEQSSRQSSTTAASTGNATETAIRTNSQSRRTSRTQTVTYIGGLTPSASTNGTASGSSTSSAAAPTNTLPCNGYPELCNRRYSNVTHVAAHNSAFSIPNNAASNQYFDTLTQLNDGIRMIQGQTHWVNNTVYNCHTSCNLLNAGPWQSQLEIIANWVANNPYDVVTILVGNSDLVKVDNYVSAIQNSGIAPYLYEPEFIPQRRDQWPTLGEMILSGKRVVLFMDYNAEPARIPYILDEFSQIWETPFSPTDPAFPCDVGRPPMLNETRAREEYMYLANHNLNTAINVGALTGGGGGGEPLLVPNVAQINTTNGQFDEFGQLESMRLNCTRQWSHPPNFLLVDYYNYGDPGPGSVFEVAARANGVEYNRRCCGAQTSGAPESKRVGGSQFALVVASVFGVVFIWS